MILVHIYASTNDVSDEDNDVLYSSILQGVIGKPPRKDMNVGNGR